MARYYFLFPEPVTEPTVCKLRLDDSGEVLVGEQAEHDSGRPGQLFIIPPETPDGHGAGLTIESETKLYTPQHGTLWIPGGARVPANSPYCEFAVDTFEGIAKPPAGGGGSGHPFHREGIVRASGRSWIDDTGPFYPVGHTLFWAPRGWKFERDRLIQNLQFLKGKGDYIRILGMVDWSGNQTDPTWPDYQQIMSELVDYAYDECGLRTQLTVTGGGPWSVVDCANRLAPVINARQHKFAKLEVANESYKNGPDLDIVREVGRILRACAPQNMVALSAPSDGWPGTVEGAMTPANSNMVTLHLDRSYGDEGWRHVRQGWDCKDAHHPCSSNEPIGPASSVASESDPLRLAMDRATSVMCGAEDYVFHNGAGIFGYPNTPGTGVPRTANLWEMPNIDAIMSAVDRVCDMLPRGTGNWIAANDGWVPPNPVIPLACLDWNDSVGPIKNYGARSPDGGFIQMPHGIKGHFRAKATQALNVTAYDPLSHDIIATATLRAGEEIVLPAPPNNRQCAYILVGRFTVGVTGFSFPEECER